MTWRLGGKRSSFRMGPGATFWWQHHASPARPEHAEPLRRRRDASTKERQSRAILPDLDRHHAGHADPQLHLPGGPAANQGSMQVLADGRIVVGWGNPPYFSEFE